MLLVSVAVAVIELVHGHVLDDREALLDLLACEVLVVILPVDEHRGAEDAVPQVLTLPLFCDVDRVRRPANAGAELTRPDALRPKGEAVAATDGYVAVDNRPFTAIASTERERVVRG